MIVEKQKFYMNSYSKGSGSENLKLLRWSPGSIPSSMEKKTVQGRPRILSKVT